MPYHGTISWRVWLEYQTRSLRRLAIFGWRSAWRVVVVSVFVVSTLYVWTHRVGRFQLTALDRDGALYVLLDTSTGRRWVSRVKPVYDRDEGRTRMTWRFEDADGPISWRYRLLPRETPPDDD